MNEEFLDCIGSEDSSDASVSMEVIGLGFLFCAFVVDVLLCCWLETFFESILRNTPRSTREKIHPQKQTCRGNVTGELSK